LAGVGVAWFHDRDLVARAEKSALQVESQPVSLARALVGPVAAEARVRKDRQHFASEVDRVRRRGGDQRESAPTQAREVSQGRHRAKVLPRSSTRQAKPQ